MYGTPFTFGDESLFLAVLQNLYSVGAAAVSQIIYDTDAVCHGLTYLFDMQNIKKKNKIL